MERTLEERNPSVGAAGGRGKRWAVPVPITVSGIDQDGQNFQEDSRTLVITRNGMMIETGHRLGLGSEITVENRALGCKSTGRVVWCGSVSPTNQASEVGLYLPQAEILCGIESVPE
jgi:hypothetical protein